MRMTRPVDEMEQPMVQMERSEMRHVFETPGQTEIKPRACIIQIPTENRKILGIFLAGFSKMGIKSKWMIYQKSMELSQ